MKRLIYKVGILLAPFLILSIVFITLDPFKLFFNPKSPLEKGVLMNDRLYQIRWLEKNAHSYNSFILGSSRSKAFQTTEWSKYIYSDSIFHMGVNDETIFGLAKKIEYLDRKNVTIKNVLIILDHRLLSLIQNQDAHIFREHPIVSGESNGEYYKMYLNAFLKTDFLKAYFNWERNHIYQPEMKNYIFKEGFSYNQLTGDHEYIDYIQLIQKDSTEYYKSRKSVFYKRNPQTLSTILNKQNIQYLNRIKQIFAKNKTNYKIIISPNYDQLKVNNDDINQLYKIFGKNNVMDYSGKNDITENIGNYYEEKHFKPYIANEIMNQLYSNLKNNSQD